MSISSQTAPSSAEQVCPASIFSKSLPQVLSDPSSRHELTSFVFDLEYRRGTRLPSGYNPSIRPILRALDRISAAYDSTPKAGKGRTTVEEHIKPPQSRKRVDMTRTESVKAVLLADFPMSQVASHIVGGGTSIPIRSPQWQAGFPPCAVGTRRMSRGRSRTMCAVPMTPCNSLRAGRRYGE